MTRVLIVGAGPAGIRCAQTLVEAGLHPIVVDEGQRAGGQIYRRPPEGFSRTAAQLYGSEAAKASALHGLFDQMVAQGQVSYLPGRSVVALGPGVAHVLGDAQEEVPFDRLVLATGATDRLAPVPGWQAGGVYSLGGAQIALKAQGVALGQRIVLAGSGPLLTLLGVQLRKAGADVAAVLDTASLGMQARGAAGMTLARPLVMARGLMMRGRLGRVFHAGARLDRIESGPNGAEALQWTNAGGKARRIACDTVVLGWHLLADTTLAELAGAQLGWNAVFHQWLPQADELGRAGEALYLAGDGMRILGADAADLSGRAAGIACLQDLGLAHPDPKPILRKSRRMTRFANAMARSFPWPAEAVRRLPDDAVLCRCEGIKAGELRANLPLSGPEANRAKSLSRVGMGRCQGRYCQLAGAEVIAAASGRAVDQVGRLRAQPPVRPVPIGRWIKEAPKAD
ncbi:FAD/NAD(P)-binding oxidoreductase [uncultured Ruegeria sp.]|uniref:NAD(P)/FAD-dependent oxidoreductase n=1 Tax=uncultured Ruegeria sp. TaxID=259304 RepID=UPI0026124B35|nr:FAD/NAD(P)-binding oxidoreductase [uncultured Ruegeria sp.]